MDPSVLGGSFYLACGTAVFLIGLLVFRGNPDARLHRVSAAMLVFGGLGPALAGMGFLLDLSRPGVGPEAGNLPTAFAYVWELFFPSLLLFSLAFPVEWRPVRHFPRLTLLVYAPHFFHLVLVVGMSLAARSGWQFDLRSLPGGEGILATALGQGLRLTTLVLGALARFHIRFFSVINLVYMVVALGLLGWSWRTQTRPMLRRQLATLLVGLGSCLGLYAAAVPIPNILGWEILPAVRTVLVAVALLAGTGSIAFAIVRTSFLDVGTVMRRAILLSAISAGLVILYFLTARPMDRILFSEIGRAFPLFQILFVILLIVFFHPLLGRVEAAADRLVHGGGAGHLDLLRPLGRELISVLDLPELTSRLLGAVEEALAVEPVRLLLRDEADGQFRAVEPAGPAGLVLEPDHPLITRLSEVGEPIRARDLRIEGRGEEERSSIDSILRRIDARLVVPVQLPDGGGCLGILCLGPKLTGARFTAEEITLLSLLSTQVGMAVRNARLHREAVARKVVDQELAMARSIQETILAGSRPSLDDLDAAAVTLPSRHVGGDYYDLIRLSPARLGVAIGDVSGKGIPAALLMSMLHAGLHAQVNGEATVGQVAQRMNRILYSSTSAEKFATFFFGVYDSQDCTIRYTNAGHNAPLVLRPDGSVFALREGGLILGVLEDTAYREGSMAVAPGDVLVFYTDGVTEATDPGSREYGEERLIATVRNHRDLPAPRIVAAVRDDVASFSGRAAFEDDFTLIVIRAF